MSEGSRSSTPIILLTLSGVGFLLSIGLCGAGGVVPNEGYLFNVGLTVLAISILLFLIGIIWFIATR